jgi:hypothetical protein
VDLSVVFKFASKEQEIIGAEEEGKDFAPLPQIAPKNRKLRVLRYIGYVLKF